MDLWTEIAPRRSGSLLHSESAAPERLRRSVLTLAPAARRPRSRCAQCFPTKELRDEAVEKYHAIEGGQQTMSNLAAYVTGTQARLEP